MNCSTFCSSINLFSCVAYWLILLVCALALAYIFVAVAVHWWREQTQPKMGGDMPKTEQSHNQDSRK
jgi:hypothetical protein